MFAIHYAKYQLQACGIVLLHSDRGIDEPDTHNHSNENIDPARTHLNYDLKNRCGLSAYKYMKQRINQISCETKERTGRAIRKDAVVLCSWAITMPKSLSSEKQSEFFREAYNWFANRYGEQNIVTAAVHLDETTPHMHLQFTPVIERDGVRRLCAKDIETRGTLWYAHRELQMYLEEKLNCPVELINGATDKVNKSIAQLQTETLKGEISNLTEQVDNMKNQAKALTLDSKKGVLESKQAYEQRKALHVREQLAAEREQALDEREQALDERERSLDKRKRSLDKRERSLDKRDYDLSNYEMSCERKANERINAISVEFSRKEKILEEEKKLIKQRAEEMARKIAEDRIDEVMRSAPKSERERMRKYMSKIVLPNGLTALEQFDDNEYQLELDLMNKFDY